MPITNFGDELNTPRLIAGAKFKRLLESSRSSLERLSASVDMLLIIRQQVIENTPPIFDNPDDLNYVNAQLVELRDEIVAFVNTLPGGPQ
jgi:hypothetical protein